MASSEIVVTIDMKNLDEVKAYIASLESQLAEAKVRLAWIPVSERLPEHGVPVLVVVSTAFADRGTVYIAYHKSEARQWQLENGLYYNDSNNRVIAWSPLPEAPKEEE